MDRTGNGCGKAPPGSRAYHRSCAGFRTDAASFSFYTSLECAQTILVANGVRADAIRPVNATRHDVRAIGRASVDLVVSFASMGFHYSVDAYAQEIAHILKPGGSLLLTITRNDGRADKEFRAGKDQLDILATIGFICAKDESVHGPYHHLVWCTLPPWGPVACRAKQG